MNTCKTCKHWNKFGGECCLPEWLNKHSTEPAKNGMALFVHVLDDSGLDVILKTGPEFGCVQWKAR